MEQLAAPVVVQLKLEDCPEVIDEGTAFISAVHPAGAPTPIVTESLFVTAGLAA